MDAHPNQFLKSQNSCQFRQENLICWPVIIQRCIRLELNHQTLEIYIIYLEEMSKLRSTQICQTKNAICAYVV